MFPKPSFKRCSRKRKYATDIPVKVKEIVWNRDDQKCIFCGKYVPQSLANAHFIKRSQRWSRHRTKRSHIVREVSF